MPTILTTLNRIWSRVFTEWQGMRRVHCVLYGAEWRKKEPVENGKFVLGGEITFFLLLLLSFEIGRLLQENLYQIKRFKHDFWQFSLSGDGIFFYFLSCTSLSWAAYKYLICTVIYFDCSSRISPITHISLNSYIFRVLRDKTNLLKIFRNSYNPCE